MSAHDPEAADDYSNPEGARTVSPGALGVLGSVLAALGFAGVALAIIATFATVIRFVSDQNNPINTPPLSGYDRHSFALLILGVFGLLTLIGAVRGAQPAMVALGLAGAAVLVVAIVFDVPDINSHGSLTSLYNGAHAVAGRGFYFETAGGVLMMLSGAGLALLVPGRVHARRRRRAAPARPAPPAAAERRTPDDWFAEDS